jgi:hypothetical protein
MRDAGCERKSGTTHLAPRIPHLCYTIFVLRISIMDESIDKKDALNSTKSHQQSHPTRVEEAELCDRCHQPMFRMRAVYWCVNCGYKTDCCGS